MKRRNFLKNCGLTVSIAAGANNVFQSLFADQMFHSPEIKSLRDVVTQTGETLVRLKFSNDSSQALIFNKGHIKVENAEIVSMTPHYFEAVDDIFDPTEHFYQLHAYRNNSDVILLRLKNTCNDTRISLTHNNQEITFTLAEILKTGFLQFEQGKIRIDVNFLLDQEIGEMELSQLGIQSDPQNFCFHVLADPQGGDPDCPTNHRTRMKIHNAFIEDSIMLANSLPERPLFTLILGDIVDSQGEKENFTVMHQLLSQLNSPVLFELGNHESRYSATFELGYNQAALQNYFDAQKKMNGTDKLLYSFNVGKWHFVIWPDPLRAFFWENHPHYFEWLERDLEKYKNRPTFVFQHVPCHPVGISPFQGYLEQVSVRKKFVDIITRHGNVKYVLSGHIHIPVKSSLKTACNIRGTNFITLPAAGYRPRGFGEEDYFGGPTQGIAIVKIHASQAEITFKTVMEEELTYPDKLPELDLDVYKLWFNQKWEIEANPNIVNRDFENGLAGWIPEYIYQEDENPSVICEARKVDGRNALYLYNRIRGYQAPGQDRLPQTINRISQVVQHQTGTTPILQFKYKLDQANCDLNGWCGGYLWIEGYEKSFRQFNLVYSAGVAYASPIARRIERIHAIHHFNLPNVFDWQEVVINIKNDFNRAENDRTLTESQ